VSPLLVLQANSAVQGREEACVDRSQAALDWGQGAVEKEAARVGAADYAGFGVEVADWGWNSYNSRVHSLPSIRHI